MEKALELKDRLQQMLPDCDVRELWRCPSCGQKSFGRESLADDEGNCRVCGEGEIICGILCTP